MMRYLGGQRSRYITRALFPRREAGVAMVAMCALSLPASAQSASGIEAAVKAFEAQCGAALTDPEGYYEAAAEGGEGNPLMVVESADATVHWIMDMRYPVVYSAQIGEIDDRTHIYCDYSVIDESSDTGIEARIDTFLSALDALGIATPRGGAMDVSGIFSEMDGAPRVIHEYAVSGWPIPGIVVVASIQPDQFSLTAEKTFNRPFTPDE